MKLTRWLVVTMLALALSPAAAQQVTLQTVPQAVAPDAPFAVIVSGVFNSPCVLAGEQMQVALDTSGTRPQLLIDLEQRPDVACPAVVVNDRQAFGPLTIDNLAAGQTVDLVFRAGLPGEDPIELARSTITLAGSPSQGAALQPGIYWDTDFPGHGVAVERQGGQFFSVLFSFDVDGDDGWYTMQGNAIADGTSASFLRFAFGGCLLCGDRVALPAPVLQSIPPAQLLVTGPNEAILALGDEANRALILQPFSQRVARSEGTIAGETFTMPDLTGRWLFAQVKDDGANMPVHRTVDLRQVASGISDSGLAVFQSPNQGVRLSCSRGAADHVQCRLDIDSTQRGIANQSHLSHSRIDFNSILAVRLD